MALLSVLNEEIIEKYIDLLKIKGENGVFRRAVASGIMRFASNPSPELEILDISDAFFSLYRRTGENDYFLLGRSLRRAAHKVYRFLLKSKNKPINMRFLNIVKS